MLCLPIPLEAATNREEFAAFEKRKQEATEAKQQFKEDPVYLKVNLEVRFVDKAPKGPNVLTRHVYFLACTGLSLHLGRSGDHCGLHVASN